MGDLSFWFTNPSVCFYVYGLIAILIGLIVFAIYRKVSNNKLIRQSPLLQAAVDLNNSYKSSLGSVSLKYAIADKNIVIGRRISAREFDGCFSEWLSNRRNNEHMMNWVKLHIDNLGKHKKYMADYIALSEKNYDRGDKEDNIKFAKREAKLYKKLCLKAPQPYVEYAIYIVNKQGGKTLQSHRYNLDELCLKFFHIDINDIQLQTNILQFFS